jgi:hypothetical protein
MANFIKQHKVEFSVFLLALVARLVFFFICLHGNGGNLIATIQGQDGYYQLSKNLFLGNGFSVNIDPPFLPYSYGVPGYPYFLFFLLWLTGSYAVTGMTQLLIGSIIPIIGMHIARLILPAFPRVPLATGILLALAPYQILFSFVFYTEAVFTFIFGIFLIVFLMFLKNPSLRFAILSGLFLGLATLIKPTVQYIPIVAVVFLLWRFRGFGEKKLFIQLGYFLLVFLLVLSPWLYRNYTTFDKISLGSQIPFNLYETLLPSVRAIANHTSFAVEQAKLSALPLDSSLEKMSSLQGQTIAEIVSRPIALVKLSTLSSITFFTHDGMLTFLMNAGVKPPANLGKPAVLLLLSNPLLFIKTVWLYMHTSMAFVLFARLFWITLTAFFILGLYKLFRLHLFSPELLFAVIIVFYFMFTTMINGLAVNARFRMPVEPIIIAVAYSGLLLTSKKHHEYT